MNTFGSQEDTIRDSKWYVKIKYSVRIQNGPLLKGGPEPEVMDFVTGYQHVVPGLERRLVGHHVGETLSFTVPAEEAFGPKIDELVIEKDKSAFHFPAGYVPSAGMELPIITNDDNAPDTVRIKEIKDDTIVIDLNHPLAGAALQYELEIIEARPATSNDVCSEWDQQASSCQDNVCGSLIQEIVLQGEDFESN